MGLFGASESVSAMIAGNVIDAQVKASNVSREVRTNTRSPQVNQEHNDGAGQRILVEGSVE